MGHVPSFSLQPYLSGLAYSVQSTALSFYVLKDKALFALPFGKSIVDAVANHSIQTQYDKVLSIH